MKIFAAFIIGTTLSLGLSPVAKADPETDRKAFQNYFTSRFPDIPITNFIHGVYAVDGILRENWEEIEEFPPYEVALDEGRRLFENPLANGSYLGNCFPNNGIGIANRYPFFSEKHGEVITLEFAIRECLKSSGAAKLLANSNTVTAIEAYMAFTSRGKPIAATIPEGSDAIDAYEEGKQFYYARRGELNMACAHCHVDHAGMRINGSTISPGLGQVSRFPVFHSDMNRMSSLHHRFNRCLERMQAQDFTPQSLEYRNLEFFLTYMSNGLTWNGPGTQVANSN